jgi:hypothetical protein
MKLTVPNKNYGIIELFHEVATLMGKANEDLKYDCRCINIAENIQDGFFTHYREEEPSLTREGITTLLLLWGPKVDGQLADNEVEIFEGFIGR